jgi:hypothetical protein
MHSTKSQRIAPWFASQPRAGIYLLLIFWPLTAMVLFFDSLALRAMGIDGQVWSNFMAPIYLLILLPALRPEQRLMALVFLPIATVGEFVFSLLFQLYTYADGMVPFYVPFGHAILFGTGLIFCNQPWTERYTPQLRWGLLAFHSALLSGAIIVFGDTLSALFTVLLSYILYRSRLRLFYLVMGILVLFVEVVGTRFGCWYWDPAPVHGLFHAVNPPVAALSCYVLADILVIRITRRMLKHQRNVTKRREVKTSRTTCLK